MVQNKVIEDVIDKEIITENTPEKTTYCFVNTKKSIKFQCKITHKQVDKFTVFPFYVDKDLNEAKNKYHIIQSFTFEGFKGKFPSGFLKSAESGGYGVTRYLSPLKKFVEKNLEGITNITVTKKGKTQITPDTLILSYQDFEDIRKGLSSTIRSSNESCSNLVNNYLSRSFPSIFKSGTARYQSGYIARILKEFKNIDNNLSSDDKETLIALFERLSISRKDIFQKQEMIKTRELIEKKFIEDILKEFEHNLKLKKIKEERWQEFFKDNSWIFSQLFAYPAVIFKDKAYVGGKTIQDAEGRIVDFLYSNKLTKNSAIIEIKKHTSIMFSKKPYRGKSVFTLDKELNGAINQVLDQKDTYLKQFESLRCDEVIAFSPKCLIIIGRISDLNNEQYKSFELLRTAMKDVEIITFDELYYRIKAILSIFSNSDTNKPQDKKIFSPS